LQKWEAAKDQGCRNPLHGETASSTKGTVRI